MNHGCPDRMNEVIVESERYRRAAPFRLGYDIPGVDGTVRVHLSVAGSGIGEPGRQTPVRAVRLGGLITLKA